MKLTVEQIPRECEEEVIVRCHDEKDDWVDTIRGAAAGQVSVCGFREERQYRVRLNDIYYFEVVDGASFFYCRKDVYKCRQKLYEFELSARERCFSGAANP